MKKLILFAATLLFVFCLNAQIVSIPDTNFKAALIAHNPVIDTNGDGEIQVNEASAYTGAIDVAFLNIFDLTGIEAFTALTGLHCFGNQLTSIDVSNNTALVSLSCFANQLSTLDVSYNNGQKKIVLNYDKRGKLDKKIISYHQNGKVSCIQQWSKGVKVGKWEYYDKNSKLIMTEKFKKGELLFTEIPPPNK